MSAAFCNKHSESLLAKLSRHLSLFVMGSGALFFFLANILLKELLNSEEYGKYSMLVVILTLLSSFGLLGFEQVFLRVSRVENGSIKRLYVEKRLLVLLGISFALSVCLSVIASFHLYFRDISPLVLFVICFCITGNLFLFSSLRIAAEYVAAQLVSNYWKILLGFGLLVYFTLYDAVSFVEIVSYIALIVFVGFIGSIIILFRKVRIIIEDSLSFKEILIFGLSFFVSLITVSVLGQGDKFLVESMIGVEHLGEYFFFANIFMSPFSFLQSYAGFKELTHFKQSGGKLFIGSLKKWIYSAGVLALLLAAFFIVIYALDFVDSLSVDYLLVILLFVVTGVVRVVYGVYSAYMGAMGSLKTIKLANTLSILTLFGCGGLLLILKESIISIMVIYLFAWGLRVIAWHFCLKLFKDYA